MIVKQSARLALIGVAVGVGLALSIAPVFAPSRQAVRVDPVTALRSD
jgi:ABC-type lipoprotein release transport system permease subunit